MSEIENNEEEKKQFQAGLTTILEKYRFNLLIASMLNGLRSEINQYLKECTEKGLVINHELSKKPIVAIEVKAQFNKVALIPLDEDMVKQLQPKKQR